MSSHILINLVQSLNNLSFESISTLENIAFLKDEYNDSMPYE